MQVYRGMPVLTQAPTKAEKTRLKAHLVSFVDPSGEYNAALFRRDAQKAITKIQKKKALPLLVGGTGLYLRALLDGLFEAKDDSKDEKYRAKLLKEQEKHGAEYLHEKLKKVDSLAAAGIHPNDHRRLVRALEVHHVTGKPMSEHKPKRSGLRDSFHCRIFMLDRDRQDLYARVEKRVDAMIKKGLMAEAKKLRRKKLGMTAAMALGLREMTGVLEGKHSLEEAKVLLKTNTRHYAKRQLSWFRHERGVEFVPVAADETPKRTAEKIVKLWKVCPVPPHCELTTKRGSSSQGETG